MKDIEKARKVVYGAICGDIIGSAYEFHPIKNPDFRLFTPWTRFTDDTVCTVACCDAHNRGIPYKDALLYWCNRYNRVGYGPMFRNWFQNYNPQPYNSWGNGSAMRVSPDGAIATSLEDASELATEHAAITHNHPEGIIGAKATATAITYLLEGGSKEGLREMIERSYGYDLHRTISEIQPDYQFEVSCQKSVPESIICFLESNSYEDTIRKAVAMGGDADTMACIAGGIAAAYYGEIPAKILGECLEMLPDDMYDVIEEFNNSIK